MSSHAWGELRSPVLPSFFFPQPTFLQRPAHRGDVLLARCGVRDHDVQPVGALHYWLHGSVLLLPMAPGDFANEAHKPARYPRIAHLIMDGESFLQEGPGSCLIPLCPVYVC